MVALAMRQGLQAGAVQGGAAQRAQMGLPAGHPAGQRRAFGRGVGERAGHGGQVLLQAGGQAGQVGHLHRIALQ